MLCTKALFAPYSCSWSERALVEHHYQRAFVAVVGSLIWIAAVFVVPIRPRPVLAVIALSASIQLALCSAWMCYSPILHLTFGAAMLKAATVVQADPDGMLRTPAWLGVGAAILIIVGLDFIVPVFFMRMPPTRWGLHDWAHAILFTIAAWIFLLTALPDSHVRVARPRRGWIAAAVAGRPLVEPVLYAATGGILGGHSQPDWANPAPGRFHVIVGYNFILLGATMATLHAAHLVWPREHALSRYERGARARAQARARALRMLSKVAGTSAGTCARCTCSRGC